MANESFLSSVPLSSALKIMVSVFSCPYSARLVICSAKLRFAISSQAASLILSLALPWWLAAFNMSEQNVQAPLVTICSRTEVSEELMLVSAISPSNIRS